MLSARSRDRPTTGRFNNAKNARGGGDARGDGGAHHRDQDRDIENSNPQTYSRRPATATATSHKNADSGRLGGGGGGKMNNPSSAQSKGGSKSEMDSSSNGGGSSFFISTARQIELNNPLAVFCPFEPEIKGPSCEISRPPVLPKNRYQTVYVQEASERPIKPYTPKEFVDKLQKPNLFEEIDMASFEDEDLRRSLTREFIDRNQSQLWKYNHDYIGKDPRQVYRDLLKSDSLIGTLKAYGRREASLRLGGSEQVKINMSDEGCNALGEIRNDYTLNSLTTSRRARSEKIERLLAPSGGQSLVKNNVRGYKHTPEYGNFSTYTAYMNLNANTALNR